jgi:hypothetical protein
MLIAADIYHRDGTSTKAAVSVPDPDSWTEGDARELVCTVWRLLRAPGGASLHLREIGPEGTYRLELISETGSVVTDPLTLSMAEVVWLQIAAFDILPPAVMHCEIDS